MKPNPTSALPSHVEDTVRSIAQMHADHRTQATPFERRVRMLEGFVASGPFAAILSALLAAWIVADVLLRRAGHPLPGVLSFSTVQGIVTILALYVTLTILATQRHESELSESRAQLTLEIALLSEQKTSKLIELLTQMRRDDPSLRDRADAEADAMSKPADPHDVLDAFQRTHQDLVDRAQAKDQT